MYHQRRRTFPGSDFKVNRDYFAGAGLADFQPSCCPMLLEKGFQCQGNGILPCFLVKMAWRFFGAEGASISEIPLITGGTEKAGSRLVIQRDKKRCFACFRAYGKACFRLDQVTARMKDQQSGKHGYEEKVFSHELFLSNT